MTTRIHETLDAKIEQLVGEYLAAQQVAVKAAVERAFAAVGPVREAPARQRAKSKRRAPAEVSGLAERVLEAVQACPGETMTVIAARVGQKSRALHRPMMRLKEAGRVRSAGERNLARYFPMAGRAG